MTTLFMLLALWGLVWLLYLNSLPPYRRQNPCHLPPDTPLLRHLRKTLPLIGLAGACIMNGLDGLFLWGFTAPVMGILLGVVLPSCFPARQLQATGFLTESHRSLNGQSLQKPPEAPKYLP